MRPNQFILYIVLLLLTGFYIPDLNAQTGSSQRQNSGSGGGFMMSPSGDAIYYVDEIGIRIATESSPFEGYIDENIYRVGAQDILSIEAQSTIPITWRGLVVNAEGFIVIPTVGSVYIGDLTLFDAKNRIRETIKKKINTDNIIISLELPKKMNVHIVGDFSAPGLYPFTANTRLDVAIINLLVGFTSIEVEGSDEPIVRRKSFFLTNRPTDSQLSGEIDLSIYNLRNLLIKHRDGSETRADLFAYLNGGKLEANPYLRDGDLIHIRRNNRNSAKIAVSGAVKSGFLADFREEDSVTYLVQVAGGFNTATDTTHFYVARSDGDKIEKIKIEGSAARDSSFSLLPNDQIIIPRFNENQTNQTVWVSGEVQTPGSYPIKENVTTFSEILSLSGGLTNNALSSGVFIERTQTTEFFQNYGWSELQMMQRTSNLLRESLDYLQVERSMATRFIFVNPADVERTKQVTLRNGDRIHIPRDDRSVLVMGQVYKTGYYPLYEDFNAFDYIQLAGNFTISAEKERVFVIKSGSKEWKSPNEIGIQSGDIIFIDKQITDDFQLKRSYDIELEQLVLQKKQQRITNIQVILSVLATVTSTTLTYIALTK